MDACRNASLADQISSRTRNTCSELWAEYAPPSNVGRAHAQTPCPTNTRLLPAVSAAASGRSVRDLELSIGCSGTADELAVQHAIPQLAWFDAVQQHAPGAAAQHVELSSSPAQQTGEEVSAHKAMLNDRQVVSRTRTVRALRENMSSFIGEMAGHVYVNPVKRHNPDRGSKKVMR